MMQHDFSQVYADYKARVWQLISRYVYTHHDREDLFQEVFLRIYQALPRFRNESALGTWIYRVTVNTALNYLKSQKRYTALKELLQKFRLIEIVEAELEIDLSKPLQKLNPQQRMILIMADVEEKKLEEIAADLKIPLGTVKSNLHRGREIVKKELSENEGI